MLLYFSYTGYTFEISAVTLETRLRSLKKTRQKPLRFHPHRHLIRKDQTLDFEDIGPLQYRGDHFRCYQSEFHTTQLRDFRPRCQRLSYQFLLQASAPHCNTDLLRQRVPLYLLGLRPLGIEGLVDPGLAHH